MPTLPGIDLYWFSGTGNSLLVAEAMANELRRLGRDVALLPLEISDPASVRSDRALGLAFPVAAFSTYPLVWRFVEALVPTTSGTPAFMVDTMASKSGGIVGPLAVGLLGDHVSGPVGHIGDAVSLTVLALIPPTTARMQKKQ